MSAQHRHPGPWRYGAGIVTAKMPHKRERVVLAYLASKELAADGRLMAAAPDLLGAARRAVKALGDPHAILSDTMGDALAVLNDAITNARGKRS